MARCILVSDDDEWVLLSKARPRRAKPLVAVTETRDGNESGNASTSVLLMLGYGLLLTAGSGHGYRLRKRLIVLTCFP
jgi:hypothetical protein